MTTCRALPGPRSLRLAAVVAAAAVGCAGGSRAADDTVTGRGPDAAQAQQEGNVVDLGGNFDANLEQAGGGWVIRANGGGFPGGGGPGGEAVSPALARVRAAGESRLARVERACELSETQRRKLQLALESDIRRCVAEIEEKRRTYQGKSVNLRDRNGQLEWNRFQRDVQECRRRLLTLFDESSLFAESLATVLDAEQFHRLTVEMAARRAFRWRALVATAMLRLDDTLALDQAQHAAIERLLIDEEPALRLDVPNRQRNEQAEQMLVFMQLAAVDQKALRTIVGDDRWKTVLTLANQGRSMRSWIEGQGLLEPKRR